MKKTPLMLVGFAMSVAAGAAVLHEPLPGTEDEGLFPFVFGQIEPASVADMSGYLDAPAGKHGFVHAVGEKFFAGGREIAFNGVNLTGPACVPGHADADITADRLARHGFNCVRLHFVDCTGYSNFRMPAKVSAGLLSDDYRTGMKFDARNLDRFDYFIAALVRRGIYVDINLRVGLTLDGRDGFPNGPSLNRGVCAIDPQLVEMEKRYAKMLLEHVNPYTERAYANDPGVAIIEIRNESALPGHWSGGLVDDLAEPWKTQFKIRWNEWLEAKYGTREALAAAWGGDWAEDFGANAVLRGKPRSGDPAYPRAVTNDFVRFVFDLDAKYWRTMGECLKKSLGVKCIVIGTLVGSSTPYFQDDGFLDAADEHLYWSHPDAISSNPCSWLCVQTAEVNFPEDGIYKATQRIAGMPFTMTETSEPFPSLFGAEHLPMMHAYGAFQGWAGVFAYTWNHTSASLPNHHEYFFSHAGRPDTQAHFPACAAITLGKAVAPAKERITVPAPESEYVERVVDKRRIILLANEALPKGADCWNECLRHGIAVDLTAAAPRPKVEPQPADKRWRSDTGELLWDVSVASNGFVTLDTKDVKFFTGFVHGRKFDFGGARLEIGKTRFDFATVTMFSKDRTGFGADGKPARLLVAATGIAKNSGQVYEVVEGLKGAWHDPDGIWTASHQGKWGRGPALVEGVPATLTLKAKSSAVKCWALDGHGRRTTEVPVVSTADGNAQLALDARYRTLWYEVKVN